MHKAISATEAVRHFSELLNGIKYRGDSYMIVRGGKPAAALVPAEEIWQECPLKKLPGLLKKLPSLAGDDSFAADVLAAVSTQPAMPEWE